jgi:hypothetical protein
MLGAGGVCKQRGYASLLQVLLKFMLIYGDSHPIINEWGEA